MTTTKQEWEEYISSMYSKAVGKFCGTEIYKLLHTFDKADVGTGIGGYS